MSRDIIKKPKKDVVVLFSGGLDSYAALISVLKAYNRERVKVVFCDLEQTYYQKEYEAVKKLCEIHGLSDSLVIDDSLFNIGKFEEKDANIPLRNLFLMSVAALHIESDFGTIVIQNIQKGETGPDRNIDFNVDVSSIISRGLEKAVFIVSPFENKTKQEIVKYLIENLVEPLTIFHTVSCFSPEEGHCGECPACFRRFIALEYNGGKA